MVEAQGTTPPGRPWHLWLIGIAGGLWSAIGVLSFILTRMNVEAVMSRFPPQQREYFASFPWWAVGFWAIGVVGGVIGCLLLLLKNRLARPVLLAAVIGTTVSSLGGLFLLGGMQVMRDTGGLGLTEFPVIVAGFLAYYAHAMSRKGVLS
jgi:preprotein translocase subunit Sss1